MECGQVRSGIDLDQVATHEVIGTVRCRPGLRGNANICGVAVVHHRALSARIVHQARCQSQLPDAFCRRGVIPGFGERVPGAEPHVLT